VPKSDLFVWPNFSASTVATVARQMELLGAAQGGSTDRLSRRVASPLKGLGRMPFKPLRRDASVGETPPQQSPSGERNDGKPVCVL